jgi:hypothetical protein
MFDFIKRANEWFKGRQGKTIPFVVKNPFGIGASRISCAQNKGGSLRGSIDMVIDTLIRTSSYILIRHTLTLGKRKTRN